MTTPTNALAAAVREAMNYGSRTDMLVALHRALAAHDAAQPSEATHTRHTLYLARHDGDWIGYPGPDLLAPPDAAARGRGGGGGRDVMNSYMEPHYIRCKRCRFFCLTWDEWSAHVQEHYERDKAAAAKAEHDTEQRRQQPGEWLRTITTERPA